MTTADIEMPNEVAFKLAEHLQQQGRLRERTPLEIGTQIQHSVRKQWGQGGSTFNDTQGPGWLMDIGDDFEGEALYAIVRRRNGKPFIQEVVEEDDLIERRRQAEGQSPAIRQETPTQEPSQSAPAPQGQMTPPPMPNMEPAPEPSDPVLIRYTGEDPKKRVSRESTHGTYQDHLQELFAKGIKPENVEVWTRVKRPKVKIELD